MRALKLLLVMGVAAMLLPSCDDVLGDLYDEVTATTTDGFESVSTDTSAGVIYVNATDYTVWTYIDFKERRLDSLAVDDPAPAQWDIAVHRYDAKTNGALVYGTSLTDINLARGWTNSTGEEGVADVWTTDKIVTDMSTMMDGYLTYADSYYNPELSKWLDVDTSVMPPIYTLSDKVYVIQLSSGEKAAVKLVDFMSAAGIKGYLTIQYIYPL